MLFLLAFICTGCTSALVESRPEEIDRSEYDRMYQAAILVLRDYGFEVNRQDYRFGRVATAPLGSPTLLEPWDDTNSNMAQTIDSTLNHIRRQVTVYFDPIGNTTAEQGPPAYSMRVEVLMEEKQDVTRFMTGSTAGPSMVGHLRNTPTELAQRGISEQYWLTTGRDEPLEQRLLAAIIRRSVMLDPVHDVAPAVEPRIDTTSAPPTEGL